MNKYLKLKTAFEKIQNTEKAVSMSKYMRNLFEFYGIPSPERKNAYKDFLKIEKKNEKIDWALLDKCYMNSHREFQYFVFDYLLSLKKYVLYEDIPKIKKYITEKSWWDTIDFLCKVIGDISLRDTRVKDLMLIWSKDSNLWVRRTAIEHQLFFKEKTDTELLEAILVNNLRSKEFFINKAIGWSLRDFSKTNPVWVRNFINKYKEDLNSLSIREGSKYI